MAIHWQVKFRSLRTNELYTVNIYDANFSGTPVQLTGAAKPFTTQEDTTDDFFEPVRTQSGYLRIVDTGKDNAGNTFNWRDFIPTTDTNRPVTLTDSNGNVKWQGFMQAQNFGAKLYEIPQEREFPVQCMLSVLSRIDIAPRMVNGMANFAKLLDYLLNTLPVLTFSKIIVQGGQDARIWLMKRFDWALFGSINEDGNLDEQTNALNAFKDMCTYWGWAAREHEDKLYLMSPDDNDYVNVLEITRSQLSALATGTVAGIVTQGGWSSLTIDDQIASKDNHDSQLRGYNKAEITARKGDIFDKIIFCYPDKVLRTMFDAGFAPDTTVTVEYTPHIDGVLYTDTMRGIDYVLKRFCMCKIRSSYDDTVSYMPVIHFDAYNDYITPCSILSLNNHIYVDGNLTLNGRIYRYGVEYTDTEDGPKESTSHMKLMLLFTAKDGTQRWWDGMDWTTSESTCFAKLGGKSGTLYTCQTKTSPKTFIYESIPTSTIGQLGEGELTIRLYGSDDITEGQGSKEFDLADFSIIYKRPDDPTKFFNPNRKDYNDYTAKNNNVVKDDWENNSMFATDNYLIWGPGIVTNQDGTYFTGWDYQRHIQGSEKPEQHLVDRVATFWARSRRKIKSDMRSDMLPAINPFYKMTFDNTILYPCSISHDWRDDKLTIIAIEI